MPRNHKTALILLFLLSQPVGAADRNDNPESAQKYGAITFRDEMPLYLVNSIPKPEPEGANLVLICDHHFKESDYSILKGKGDVYRIGDGQVFLEVCSKCGILRVKPKEK